MHSGGIDLQYPHHENEIAQSEAFYNNSPWCRIFTHTGHVNIRAEKMSKSLGNSITIKSLLQEYHPLDFRMFCLLHDYKQSIEYGQDMMHEARAFRKKITRIFGVVRSFAFERKRLLGSRFSSQDSEMAHLYEMTNAIIYCL